MEARCLSMHARYRCRQTGICCEVGWPIPVEPGHAAMLVAHFGSRRGQPVVPPDPGLAGGGQVRLAVDQHGHCICYEGAPERSCAIHRELGESALPVPCRHFPRVVLRDGRGLSVTLSHFCPTAVDLLFDDGPVGIVPAPATLTLGGQAQGLDATAVLPPLLRPGMLMDLEAYDRWEHQAVGLLADARRAPLDALSRIDDVTTSLASWTPGDLPLAAAVDAAFENVADVDATVPPGSGSDSVPPAPESPGEHDRRRDPRTDARCLTIALDVVPPPLDRPDPVDATALASHEVMTIWDEHAPAIRRYLASRLFASWFAYDGAGPASVVAGTSLAGAIVRAEIARRLGRPFDNSRQLLADAIRAADLLLVHLVDHRQLARRLDTAPVQELLT